MSIITIKQELETYLNTNITTTAIKWTNTTVTTLNSTTLTQAQVDALTLYIEPQIIPIQSPRDLISDPNGVNHQVFFQVSIFIKKNAGTGTAYTLSETLDTLFRDKNINGVICEEVETLPSFELEEWVVFPIRILSRIWG